MIATLAVLAVYALIAGPLLTFAVRDLIAVARRRPLRPWTWRRCRHDRQRCIHGDEIIAAGWRRGHCLDCGRWLKPLPGLCTDTGRPHLALDR